MSGGSRHPLLQCSVLTATVTPIRPSFLPFSLACPRLERGACCSGAFPAQQLPGANRLLPWSAAQEAFPGLGADSLALPRSRHCSCAVLENPRFVPSPSVVPARSRCAEAGALPVHGCAPGVWGPTAPPVLHPGCVGCLHGIPPRVCRAGTTCGAGLGPPAASSR